MRKRGGRLIDFAAKHAPFVGSFLADIFPLENLCISSYGNLAANFRAAFVYI